MHCSHNIQNLLTLTVEKKKKEKKNEHNIDNLVSANIEAELQRHISYPPREHSETFLRLVFGSCMS